MESDITVLRDLSKKIDLLLAHDEFYVTQLDSISQALMQQVDIIVRQRFFSTPKMKCLNIADQ